MDVAWAQAGSEGRLDADMSLLCQGLAPLATGTILGH